tara:strand:+ start:442 stop:1620 length:1179 start_codon:yes stop_codon:yes gene_type:complete
VKKLIFGYGATGKSVEAYFQKNNIEYFIYDDYKEKEIPKNQKFNATRFVEVDEVIISPGIKPTHELLNEINSQGLSVKTDIDLFNEIYKGKLIGITGTNGKTTLVNLLTSFLNLQGIKAAAVGNVGRSPLEVMNKGYEYIVIELSSFQLYYLNNLNLHIGIILNIYQDHLDWHKNFEEYVESKKRIKEFIKNGEDSKKVNNFFGSYQPGTTNLNLYSEIKENSILFDNTVDIFMQVIEKLELNYESAKEYLINSQNSEHRFELVDVHKGITYINDSKSTNFNSVSMATTKVNNGILIMHGLTKNIDSKDLDISKEIKTIILPKDMKVDLNNTLAEVIELDSIFDLEEKLEKNINSGDTVLFSCGGASFNDFKNYEERGNFFKSVVRNIKVKK